MMMQQNTLHNDGGHIQEVVFTEEVDANDRSCNSSVKEKTVARPRCSDAGAQRGSPGKTVCLLDPVTRA